MKKSHQLIGIAALATLALSAVVIGSSSAQSTGSNAYHADGSIHTGQFQWTHAEGTTHNAQWNHGAGHTNH